ncbi:energy-coupling factor transport system ATP-binding protein [Arthrobacter stackebrandtii]|uniref:Energy-coupling factor transport system ATP-binding protein n=1 Tax=Arthrobacter stackebrandtii TaxID=272161 RepID=A0ABS4YWZ7_9MICC|nr:energy-coupling factor transport system ATP-binding protein [Arthrobacter stackebrandtii]PYH02265.1 ABC transporter ATP-binding protein [Arthrobacter stackebrandtii]
MASAPLPKAGAAPARITARGWGWQHSGRSAHAVQGLDLAIEPGERVLLLGPSGAGKSTLLHALAGVLGQDEDANETGELLIDGRPVSESRGRAGLMQQDPDAQVVLSRIGDDVAFGAENLAVPREEIWRRVPEALESVGLTLPLDHPSSALSGGQKQRLGLAGMLAMRPGLLLLDEPTANLDPAGVVEVRDAVRRSLDDTGATLVVVEHRVSVWLDVVDRIIVLAPAGLGQPGGVLFDGPPATVLAQSRELLAGAGIWVPGFVPAVRPRTATPDAGAHLLLEAQALAVSRTRGRKRRPVVPAAVVPQVQVVAGQALSVTGPNGAGKSTLALTLAGLLAPAGGRLSALPELARGAGADPLKWRGKQLISRIGTVFQEPEHQFVAGTVRDELLFGPRILGRGEEQVDGLLARLRLEHLAEANPFTLSGGEKRRLSVATVLAASPQVLVLDEPTFGQDANTWAELASLLTELLDAGTAVVSVTHDAAFSAALGGARLDLGTPACAAVEMLGIDVPADRIKAVRS